MGLLIVEVSSHLCARAGVVQARRSVAARSLRLKAKGTTATLEASLSSSRENLDTSSALSLHNIRRALIRQEDTIIFSLIERAQFGRNSPVYEPHAIPVPGFGEDGERYSLLEWLLRETEQIHGKIRRYTSPDENAFFPNDVPPLVLPPMSYPKVLAANARSVNINEKIMAMYIDHILPGITQEQDDNNYGSTAMYDVLCLQALSKRVHYGKFVAEAKFIAQTKEYTALIEAQDSDGIMELLTNKEVERKVVERVRRKAALYGQDVDPVPSSNGAGHDSDANGAGPAPTRLAEVLPDIVAELYDHWVMPLTKDVEVAYLLRRLDADAQR